MTCQKFFGLTGQTVSDNHHFHLPAWEFRFRRATNVPVSAMDIPGFARDFSVELLPTEPAGPETVWASLRWPAGPGDCRGGRGRSGFSQLRYFRGKVVLLSFWFSTCPPCRDLFPHEQRLVKLYQGKPFVMLGVNLDAKAEGGPPFAAKRHSDLALWWDRIRTIPCESPRNGMLSFVPCCF